MQEIKEVQELVKRQFDLEKRHGKLEKKQIKADILLRGIQKAVDTLTTATQKNHEQILDKIEHMANNTSVVYSEFNRKYLKKEDMQTDCPHRDKILSIKFRVGLYQIVVPALTSIVAAMAMYIWLK